MTISPFTRSVIRTSANCGEALIPFTRFRNLRIATSLLPGLSGAVSACLLVLNANGVGEDGGLTIGFSAALIDSLTVRYFPTLTEEIEYITTKKANSSVIKSA